MGFDGLFFGRADYQDVNARHNEKTLEMVWKGSANLGQLSIRLESALTKKYIRYFRSSGLVIHWYSA
jgi:hypothetical protein